jgi:hypothetical protein
LTIVFVWIIVETIGGGLISKILASSALLFSLLIRINILYQPNSFDILAWTIVFYLLIRYVQSEKSIWLFLLAVIVAFGIYNKYNIAFLIIGLAISLLLTSQRKIFSKFSFWKALIFAVLLILPNIIWQIVHHFPVLDHMKVLKENQLDNNSVAGFLRSQIMFFFGSLPLTVGALIAFAWFKPFKQYRFIGFSFVTIVMIFALLKAKDYYSIGLYPVMFAFASVFFEKILSAKWKFFIIPLLISINLAVFISIARLVLPVLSPSEITENSKSFEKLGLLRWEDGKNHMLPQDFADMLGWKEMAEKALTAYNIIPENEYDNTLIICDNYGQTGALNYYNRTKMPEAYSFNTDYIYWLPQLEKIKNIVLVGEKPDIKVTYFFAEVRLAGIVENEFAREKGTEIYILIGANNNFTSVFYKLAQDRKNRLDIF